MLLTRRLVSHRLAEVLKHQAMLFERIVSEQRFYPDYFRVAFYGDFPAALRNKEFIVRPLIFNSKFVLSLCIQQYRGFEWEKYDVFCTRMLQKHAGARLLHPTDEINDTIKFGSGQYIHCTPVVPEPDRTSPIFTNPDVPPSVRTYYEHRFIFLVSKF
jgi:dedicator of cytokinesis protein 3